MNIKKDIYQTQRSFNEIYKKGYNKAYPSIELVRISKILKINKSFKILDYGCGPGTNGIHFLHNGNKVHFADISYEAIKTTKKKIPLKLKKNSTFTILNPNEIQIPILSNSIDLIICLSVYNNFINRNHANLMIKEFNRVLKKNGLLILDFNLSNNNYTTISNDKKNSQKKTLPNSSTKKTISMYFPNSKSPVINDLKKSNFKLLDQGYSNWKVFNSFEHEIILTAKKLKKI